MVSEIVLWQDDIYSEEYDENGDIPYMQDGLKYETYINGIQLATYAYDGEFLIDAEELIGEGIA